MSSTIPVWEPGLERKEKAYATQFINTVNHTHATELRDWNDLYTWSIENSDLFWLTFLNFAQIQLTGSKTPVIENRESMFLCRWFPNASLNIAERLLSPPHLTPTDATKDAIIFRGERGERRCLSYHDVRQQTAALAHYFKKLGVTRGSRVAALLPNIPETVIAMLAAASIGAVFSSCAPAFGSANIIDRFEQIAPVVLIVSDGYLYGEKEYSLEEKVQEVITALPSLKTVIRVSHLNLAWASPAIEDWNTIVQATPLPSITFTKMPFAAPMYIMFSSGTTGKPKCIVHSAGGTLLEHLKELMLHTDVGPEDKIMYQTNCGWMMWNWLVSALGTGATIVLYDGSPLLKNGSYLFEIIEEEKVSVFGTNPKYLTTIEKNSFHPSRNFKLTNLKTILSTGSPLLPQNFEYVYNSIKADVCLSSIAGGTDIIGCFALGSPLLPVYSGELQCRSLGYKVEVFDEHGVSQLNTKGELVCTAPFPSMPISFWNDHDNSRRFKTYFKKFKNTWYHGDYVTLNTRGSMVIYGRSDAVLNPGGVRIGTSEIYREVEALPQVQEALAVGQEWEDDSRIILFVQLKTGILLTEDLKEKIKVTLRKNASPFHVPSKIIQVTDIPKTRNGKIAELAVTAVIHGRDSDNTNSLANPESLEQFRNLTMLET
jgi:acetoacetyl-CoA synthetase